MASTVAFPPNAIWSGRNGAISQDVVEIAQQHDRFQLTLKDGLFGRIQDSRRRIPYSSDKRDFLAKTGREAFEVYEYEFRAPGDPPDAKPHTVMWDCEIGLVRVTPFFKACRYAKTIPKRALDANGALRLELSHNVTGGALTAQGYWAPYACARALCLTFCHPIRWALTPIFGPSFVNECLHPTDPGFGRFKIDPQLVADAQAEAEKWEKRTAQHRQQVSGSRGGISTRASSARASSSRASSARAISARANTASAATSKKRSTKHLQPRQNPIPRSLVRGNSDDDFGYGPGSPPVSPKTIPNKSKQEGHSSTWSAVNKPGDSVTSERPSLSPYLGSITPLILPAPVVPQQNLVNKTVHKSLKHNKRKAEHKAKQAPTSYPAVTVFATDRDDSDEAYYGAKGDDYIIRSPTASDWSMSPPSKRAKQPQHRLEETEQQTQADNSSSVSGAKTLNNAEMVAVYGLLKLVGDDGDTRQCHIEID